MILNLSMEELENLRRFQHSKDFEPYCTQIACILMLAHGHDAKTISYDLAISPYSVYNYAGLYMLGDISKLTDNRLKSYCMHNSHSTYACEEKGGHMRQFTVSGRYRINLNGFLNARDAADVIALDCHSVNAQFRCQLYEAAPAKHPKTCGIYVISDDARFYRNKHLTQRVKGTRAKQFFFWLYSPNLTLIEHQWKMLRRGVVNTTFYRAKEKFRQAVMNFFDSIADYKQELEPLLLPNLRMVNSKTILV